MRIDAHQHFWTYTPAAYGWIEADVLKRDFLPPDLAPRLQATGLDGAVAVQARQTLEETTWLLGLADAYDFVKGVVGWVPLRRDDLPALLERAGQHPRLKGVREVLQGQPEEAFFEDEAFNRGVAHLTDRGLTYDILIYEDQLPAALRFIDRHPGQVFILDHLAKPRIREGSFEGWERHIRSVARRPHVFCKVSGMVTEADHAHWQERELVPYLETVLDCFGPSRLMFGSDWPVCLLAAPYERWYQAAAHFFARLSPDEQAQVFGGTAVQVYRLT